MQGENLEKAVAAVINWVLLLHHNTTSFFNINSLTPESVIANMKEGLRGAAGSAEGLSLPLDSLGFPAPCLAMRLVVQPLFFLD